jgi:hypothetical protein
MPALAVFRLPPLCALRLTDKMKRRFGFAALVVVGIGLAALMRSHQDPHDPGECHVENPDMPTPLPGDFRITQVASPYTVDLFNKCPGGLSLSLGQK